MRFDGSHVQNEIYVTGESPRPREGVAALLTQLAAETDLTPALAGGTSVRTLDTEWIAASS